MTTYRGFFTFWDASGTYSDGGDFQASHWTDAMSIGNAKVNELVRGDQLTMKSFVSRDENGDILSYTIQADNGEGERGMVTVTLA